jgi:group I intron endonuclease
MYGLIYKVTNIQNRKVYIGKTTKSLEYRKRTHETSSNRKDGFIFQHALKKYGFKNFKWEILGYCKTKEKLDKAEIECIWFFQSQNRYYGYNIHCGGTGGNTITEENKLEFIKKIKNSLQNRTKEQKILTKKKRKETYLKNNSLEKQISSLKQTLKEHPEIKEQAEIKRQITITTKYESFYKEIHKKRIITEKNNPEISLKRIESYKTTLKKNPEINKKRGENYKIDSFVKNIIKKSIESLDFIDLIDVDNILKPSNYEGGKKWLLYYCEIYSKK